MQWLHLAAHPAENLPFSQNLMKNLKISVVAQSHIISYEVKITSHIVVVSTALLFLYLKRRFKIFCLSLAFSCRRFISNFILFSNYAQIFYSLHQRGDNP